MYSLCMSPLSRFRGVHVFMLYLRVAYAGYHSSTAAIFANMELYSHSQINLVFFEIMLAHLQQD